MSYILTHKLNLSCVKNLYIERLNRTMPADVRILCIWDACQTRRNLPRHLAIPTGANASLLMGDSAQLVAYVALCHCGGAPGIADFERALRNAPRPTHQISSAHCLNYFVTHMIK